MGEVRFQIPESRRDADWEEAILFSGGSKMGVVEITRCGGKIVVNILYVVFSGILERLRTLFKRCIRSSAEQPEATSSASVCRGT